LLHEKADLTVLKNAVSESEKVERCLPMINKNSTPSLPVARNLKRSFENAVRDIYEAGRSGKVSNYRTPIVQRAGRAASEPSVIEEKRALSDAARALAQLWKVSPHSSR
jgi:hypothetical protein